VSAPTAGGASYAAAKAAAEAWTLAVADGFRRAHAANADAGAGTTGQGSAETDSAQHEKPELRGAAAIFVVKALVDAGMRAKSPERSFPGFTDVADLAAAAAGLFNTPAGELNGQRLLLSR
jgi:hypothetical protein